jgi:archaellum biogenesis protein FlaJ (TadC family)
MSHNSTTAKTILTNILRLVFGLLFIGAMFFLPAGTFDYWQAWAWLATLFIPMGVSFVYLVKRDPALLERRTRTNETRTVQKWIIAASVIYFLIVFVLPGFDKRFGWSAVPVWLVIVADLVVLCMPTRMPRASSKWNRASRSSPAAPMPSSAIPCIFR